MSTPLKKGDLFCAPLNSIMTWGFTEYPRKSIMGRTIQQRSTSYNTFDMYTKPDMVLIFKYLGNGIVEEMTTRERLIINHASERYFEDYKTALTSYRFDVYPNYSDYVLNEDDPRNTYVAPCEPIEEYNKFDSRISDYKRDIKHFKTGAAQFPLILNVEAIMDLNSITKLKYVEHDDKERKTEIKRLKKIALEEIKNILREIKLDSRTIGIIDDEDLINEARLDNQVYDYYHKK